MLLVCVCVCVCVFLPTRKCVLFLLFFFFSFFMLVLPVEYIFLATFFGLHFNHQFFYTLHYTISQVLSDSCRPLRAAFMYCFKHLSFLTCGYSFKLHSLDYSPADSVVKLLIFKKNSCLCWDLNQGPLRYQADMLPTELSWLGCFISSLLKEYNLSTQFCLYPI